MRGISMVGCISDDSANRCCDHSSRRFCSCAAFLLGLLSANNIVYVFTIGNTPIYLICIYAAVLNVVMAIRQPRDANKSLAIVPGLFLLYLGCVALSSISVLLFHGDYSYQFITGLINLVLFLNVAGSAIMLRKDLNWIIRGVVAGILLNAAISAYVYYLSTRGVIFSLDFLFPNAGIQVPNEWNDFRARGLFKEPGHLARYLTISFFLVMFVYPWRKKLPQIALFLIMIVLMGMTRSSSVALFAIALIIYMVFSNQGNKATVGIVALSAFAVMAIIYLVFIPTENYWVLAMRESLLDPFSQSGGNMVREQGFAYGLELFFLHPIMGNGWNTVTPLFHEYGFYGTTDLFGTYSYVLTSLVHIGLPGTVVLIVFLLGSAFKLLRVSSWKAGHAVGAAVLMLFMILLTTDLGLEDACSCLVLGVLFLALWYQKNVVSTEAKNTFDSQTSVIE